jgi:hypothetical protein
MAANAPPISGAPAAWRAAGALRSLDALYVVGALMLAGQAAVHVQQFASIFHEVKWIGPLFLGDAASCLLAAAGLARVRLRPFAALAGIAVSAGALGGLAVSYGTGLFGWMEAGWRTATALAVASEVGAIVVLAAALAASAARYERRPPIRVREWSDGGRRRDYVR